MSIHKRVKTSSCSTWNAVVLKCQNCDISNGSFERHETLTARHLAKGRRGGGGNSYMANFLSSGGWAFDFLCPSRFVVVMGKLTKYFFGRGKTIGVKIIDSAQFLHDTPDDFFLGTLMFHNTLVECHTLRFTALGGREKKYFWFKTRIKMIFFKLNLYRLKKFMGWWGIG